VSRRAEYLRFSPFAYPFGIAYERLVNSTDALRRFRVILIAVLEKKTGFDPPPPPSRPPAGT
jgi:hypothetical protein